VFLVNRASYYKLTPPEPALVLFDKPCAEAGEPSARYGRIFVLPIVERGGTLLERGKSLRSGSEETLLDACAREVERLRREAL